MNSRLLCYIIQYLLHNLKFFNKIILYKKNKINISINKNLIKIV